MLATRDDKRSRGGVAGKLAARFCSATQRSARCGPFFCAGPMLLMCISNIAFNELSGPKSRYAPDSAVSCNDNVITFVL